jgi:hypothetical protein
MTHGTKHSAMNNRVGGGTKHRDYAIFMFVPETFWDIGAIKYRDYASYRFKKVHVIKSWTGRTKWNEE